MAVERLPAEQSVAEQANATPLYRQVREIVLQRIARGDWQPGTLLPAEPKLGLELGVSPGTVRKALDELAADNLVVRQQGRGTFVAAQTPDSSLFHFFRLIDRHGQRVTPTSRELGREQGPATQEERRRLALQARARVVRIRRLRQAGDGAIIERIVVPSGLFPGLYAHQGELPNTLYDLYQRRYGKTVRRASESLCARALDDPEDARLLQLAPGAPVLEIDRLAYSFADLPIEWRRSLVDTSKLRYLSELV
jgi:GntR family transcriptional regulator